MTRLEDVLRDTLATDPALPTDADAMARRVRDGVRLRRTQRVRAVAVTAVAVLAAIVVFVGVRGHDAPPSPAPRPVGLQGLDRQPWPDEARYITVGGPAAYAVVVDMLGCRCSVLHRYQDGTWKRVHSFDTAFVSGPVFANDGRRGWLQVRQRVLFTADGGETWAPVNLPGRAPGDHAYSPTLVGDEAWVTSESGGLWRVPAGSSVGEPTTVEGIAKVQGVTTVGNAVEVTSMDGRTKRSTDGGRTWADASGSCGGDFATAGEVSYLICGKEPALYRWAPGADAPTLVRKDIGDDVRRVVPLADGRVALLRQYQPVDVVQPDGSLVEGGRLPDAQLGESVTVDKVTYLGTSDGVYRTTDGREWELTDPNATPY